MNAATQSTKDAAYFGQMEALKEAFTAEGFEPTDVTNFEEAQHVIAGVHLRAMRSMQPIQDEGVISLWFQRGTGDLVLSVSMNVEPCDDGCRLMDRKHWLAFECVRTGAMRQILTELNAVVGSVIGSTFDEGDILQPQGHGEHGVEFHVVIASPLLTDKASAYSGSHADTVGEYLVAAG